MRRIIRKVGVAVTGGALAVGVMVGGATAASAGPAQENLEVSPASAVIEAEWHAVEFWGTDLNGCRWSTYFKAYQATCALGTWYDGRQGYILWGWY